MIDTFDLYNDFKTSVNTQQGGFFSPQVNFIKAANLASINLWEKLTIEAEKSQEVKDKLLPFLVSKNIQTVQSNSYYTIATPPVDYSRFASATILTVKEKKVCVPSKDIDKGMCLNGKGIKGKDKYVIFKSDEELAEDYYSTVTESEVEMIDNQRWSAALQHLRKLPTFEKPKLTQINGGFKIAPRDIGVIILNCYTRPTDATLVYTSAAGNLQTGSGGGIVYNKALSIPFQWNVIVKNDLLEMIKDIYIGFTRDGLFQQISTSQKQ
jgi:hypothetical protein